jgi:hypothetical protein
MKVYKAQIIFMLYWDFLVRIYPLLLVQIRLNFKEKLNNSY